MKFIKFGRKKGKFFEIFFDDELLGLYKPETINKFNIENGKPYSEDYMALFKEEGELEYAKFKALNAIGRRDYSKHELFKNLTNYVSKKAAKLTVLKLEQLGLVDDLKFAKNLAEKLILTKKRGISRVLYELQSKGIKKQAALDAIEYLKFNSVEIIVSLIEKKYLEKLKNSKPKLIATLLRQGHNYNDIKNAINIIEQKHLQNET